MAGTATIAWITSSNPLYDSDAQAFFDATGISDSTIKSAINTFVLALKSNSLWSLADAIYPVVGGTSTTHKFNLKNPLDTNAAFRLSFNGGWTHSSTGMTPNGSTGYANTFYIPNTQVASGLIGHGIYIRSNVNGTLCDMGAYNATGTKQSALWSRFGDVFYGISCEDGILSNVANTDSRGWFFSARTSGTSCYLQKNSTQTTKTANVSPPTVSIYLGARNDDSVASFLSSKEIAFAWLGQTLSQAEASTLYPLIQTLQTSLSRSV